MNSSRIDAELRRIVASEWENITAYRKAGNLIFDRMTKIIKQFSSFRISRQIVAGSIGKRTSLGYDFEPDFDVILFVKDVAPPLKPIVDHFYDILMNSLPATCDEWRWIDRRRIEKTPFGLILYFDTIMYLPSGPQHITVSFDLLPAVDLSGNIEEQARLVLEQIRKNNNPERDWGNWSTSLCEKTVKFVNAQSDFVHRIILLAKLWDNKLKKLIVARGGRSKFNGRSSVIELLAIQAGIQNQGNLYAAFSMFLEFCRDMNRVHVNFCGSRTYQTPLILDAVNPYNNYAKAISPIHMEHFKIQANKTLQALQELVWVGCTDYEGKLANFKDCLDGF